LDRFRGCVSPGFLPLPEHLYGNLHRRGEIDLAGIGDAVLEVFPGVPPSAGLATLRSLCTQSRPWRECLANG
jgi:hypothetical protein